LLKKDINAEVSPLGNPAMPMKMPFGPQWFQDFDWPMPNLLMAGVPGFEKLATGLMKKTFKNKGVASVEELRSLCLEADVHMIACQMTVDVFGFDNNDFIPEVTDYVGATSFLPVAQNQRRAVVGGQQFHQGLHFLGTLGAEQGLFRLVLVALQGKDNR